jgi:hypothetical protein
MHAPLKLETVETFYQIKQPALHSCKTSGRPTKGRPTASLEFQATARPGQQATQSFSSLQMHINIS